MKRILLVLFVVSALQQVRSESLRPEVEARLMYLIDQYTIRVGHSAPDPGIFLNYAATNKISRKDVYRIIERYADEQYREMETVAIESEKWSTSGYHLSRILVFIGGTGEKSWIPFLQKMYRSSSKIIRTNVALAYIDIMRADSVKFVENGFNSDDFDTGEYRRIYRKLQAQLKDADNPGRVRIFGFFLRRMENATSSSDQKSIDQILADNFPEYRASIQRVGYAKRFLTYEHDFARERGRNILQEIEKVPAAQRKDLSELLRKPADEMKVE